MVNDNSIFGDKGGNEYFAKFSNTFPFQYSVVDSDNWRQPVKTYQSPFNRSSGGISGAADSGGGTTSGRFGARKPAANDDDLDWGKQSHKKDNRSRFGTSRLSNDNITNKNDDKK